jgi:hypothetical protein
MPTVAIRNADQPHATLIAPQVNEPGTPHLIISVTNEGDLPLTSARRLVLTIKPS